MTAQAELSLQRCGSNPGQGIADPGSRSAACGAAAAPPQLYKQALQPWLVKPSNPTVGAHLNARGAFADLRQAQLRDRVVAEIARVAIRVGGAAVGADDVAMPCAAQLDIASWLETASADHHGWRLIPEEQESCRRACGTGADCCCTGMGSRAVQGAGHASSGKNSVRSRVGLLTSRNRAVSRQI